MNYGYVPFYRGPAAIIGLIFLLILGGLFLLSMSNGGGYNPFNDSALLTATAVFQAVSGTPVPPLGQ